MRGELTGFEPARVPEVELFEAEALRVVDLVVHSGLTGSELFLAGGPRAQADDRMPLVAMTLCNARESEGRAARRCAR